MFIDKAEFGRMRIGKCVSARPIDCQANALGFLDQQCSGRRTCEVRVADPHLASLDKCDEYKSYLDVSHTCLKGGL